MTTHTTFYIKVFAYALHANFVSEIFGGETGAALGTTPTGGSSLSSSPTGGLMIGLEGAQSAHAKGMWGRVQGGVRPLLPRGYNHRKIFKLKHRKSCSFMHSGLHKYGLLTYYSVRNRLPCDCSCNRVGLK
jgi:hypothetical protein